MALTLDSVEVVNATIDKYEINSFAIDLDRLEIIIAYDKLDLNGANLGEAVLVVDGPQFPAAIQEASVIAGADVYAALKQALYNQITLATGKTGTVV